MRSPLLTLALIATLLPGLSAAQTTSTTIQSGDGNQSTTVQSGQTAAATIQAGDGNVASTTLASDIAGGRSFFRLYLSAPVPLPDRLRLHRTPR